jgi:hypothetical protein
MSLTNLQKLRLYAMTQRLQEIIAERQGMIAVEKPRWVMDSIPYSLVQPVTHLLPLSGNDKDGRENRRERRKIERQLRKRNGK